MEEAEAGWLGKFDLFSTGIYLKMQGNQKVTTYLGGFLTMIFIAMVIPIFIIQMVDIVNHTNPQISTTTAFENPPKGVKLDQNQTFVFALQTTVNGTALPLSASLLNISAATVRVIKNGSQVLSSNQTYINLRQCNPNDFNFIGNGDSVYDNYTLVAALCPDNFSYEILGSETSNVFQYVSFKVSSCLTANSLAENVTCADSNTAYQYWSDSEVKLNLFFSNNNVDAMDYDAPKELFFDNIFWIISPNFTKQSIIFMDAYTINDYNNFFENSIPVNHTLQNLNPSNIDDQQGFTSTDISIFQGNLLSITLQRSFNEITTNRVYKTGGQLLGYVGGLARTILFILAIFVIKYSKTSYEVNVINEIYDTKPLMDDIDRRISGKSRSSDLHNSIELPNRHQELFNSARSDSEEKAKAIAKCFDLHKQTRGGVTHTPADYFRSMFWKKNDELNFQEIAIKRGTEDIDIIQIVEKLREVDKLIDFTMTPAQKVIFGFLPKRLISKDDDLFDKETLERVEERSMSIVRAPDELDNLLDRVASLGDYNKYIKLYKAYRKMRGDDNFENKTINSRLLNLVGDDRLLADFREIDAIIEGLADDPEFEIIFKDYLKKSDIYKKND